MALQLGVSNIDVYSAPLTQTYVWWWTLPSFISTANKRTFDLLLTVLMKAEKLELLFRVIKKLLQKPVQIFFICSSITDFWWFSMLYFTASYHQVFSAFPQQCRAAVSGPAFKGRTLLSVIHCGSVTITHFTLLTAITSSENRNGGKQNSSQNITNLYLLRFRCLPFRNSCWCERGYFHHPQGLFCRFWWGYFAGGLGLGFVSF